MASPDRANVSFSIAGAKATTGAAPPVAPTVTGKKANWRIRDFAFWGLIGFLAISTAGSISIIIDPEGYAQRQAQREAEQAEKAARQEARETARAADAAKPKLEDEAILVTQCDWIAQRMMKNPSSFDTAWSWETIDHRDGRATFLRNFTAMNGFGANLDHYYRCDVDYQRGTVVDIKFQEGNY